MTDISQPVDTVNPNLEGNLTATNSVEAEEWEWNPPDLSPGSLWHQARVESLYIATEGMADRERHRQDRLRALEIHRHNFEGNGTMKQLQILWWEFPPEHWDTL